MSRRPWPPSLRQRTHSALMLILASTGYRKWLSRPWQWSLRDYMIVVAICSAALALSGYPAIMIIFFTAVTGAIYICLSLAGHGFKITDVITLLAMILVGDRVGLRMTYGHTGQQRRPGDSDHRRVQDTTSRTRPDPAAG